MVYYGLSLVPAPCAFLCCGPNKKVFNSYILCIYHLNRLIKINFNRTIQLEYLHLK